MRGELAAAGQTIVPVEQNVAAAIALAQRIYIINNGYIVQENSAAEIKASPEILHRHLGCEARRANATSGRL